MGYFDIRVKDAKTGKEVKHYLSPNMMPDAGLQLPLDLIQSSGDTGCGTTSGYLAFGSWGTQIDSCDAVGNWAKSGTAETAVISTGTVMEGNGSLQLENAGSGTAIWTDTTVIGDLSDYSTGWLWMDFYIWDTDDLASSDGFTYKIGSDSSNYVKFDYDRADLRDRWIRLPLDLDNPTATVGTPDWNNIDYQVLQTIAAGSDSVKIWIDDIRIGSAHPVGHSTDIILAKEFAADSRYQPDSTDRTGTRSVITNNLASGDANNSNIREFAIVGDDATASINTGTMVARTVLSGSFTKDANLLVDVDYIFRM